MLRGRREVGGGREVLGRGVRGGREMRVCVRVVCVHRRWQSRLSERGWGIGWRGERSISAAQMRGVVQSRGFQSWGCAEWRGDEIRVGGVVQGVWGGRGGERG